MAESESVCSDKTRIRPFEKTRNIIRALQQLEPVFTTIPGLEIVLREAANKSSLFSGPATKALPPPPLSLVATFFWGFFYKKKLFFLSGQYFHALPYF